MGITYNGFVYVQEVDFEDDNVKIFHSVVTPYGATYDIDMSPYTRMTQEAFELFIDCGMPRREHLMLKSPISLNDLKFYHLAKASNF